MNDFICNHPFISGIIIVGIPIITILICVAKPWCKFICWSKTDEWSEDDIRYNIFNKTYYYCHNDHYGCIWKEKMTQSRLKEYDLIINKSLKNKGDKNNIKNEIKMENSKSSLLLKILKRCFLIIIIILTYKIGMIIIETVPNLVKNQLTTINK